MTPTAVTNDHLDEFNHHGFTIVRDALSADELSVLLAGCEKAVAEVHRNMDTQRVNVIGGSRRGLQYTPGNCRKLEPDLRRILFGPLMRDICYALVGSHPYLVWEQYSVKQGLQVADTGATFISDGNPQSLGHFSWHQDSGYVPRDHPPYLSCWMALDDITADNGPLAVLPFSDLGIKTRVTHQPDPDNGDLTGYFGTLPGRMLEVSQGTVVCFSSTLFHRSAKNDTASPRRAYLAQYAPSMHDVAGETLWHDAEPFPQ